MTSQPVLLSYKSNHNFPSDYPLSPMINYIDLKTSTTTSSVFADSPNASYDQNRYSFLWNRIKVFTISFDNFSFTVEELISNPVIREQAIDELQKRIKTLSDDLLDEIKKGNYVNLQTAKKMVSFQLGNIALKILNVFIKIFGLSADGCSDFQKLISFLDKIISGFCKWHAGNIQFNKKELMQKYFTISTACDAISSTKDVLSILDDNWFIKWGYYFAGYGWEFTPIAGDFLTKTLLVHEYLTPVRWCLKYNKLTSYRREYIELEKNALGDKDKEEKLIKLSKKIPHKSLDFVRESIKFVAWAGVTTGVISSTPYLITLTVSGLSLHALSRKIHKCWTEKDKTLPAAFA